MTESPDRPAQEGDELWLGLLGPLRVSNAVSPERMLWSEATRVAQAAHALADLADLVMAHPDWRVRHEAIPRLRARFPQEALTFQALGAASRDPEAGVRGAAVHGLTNLGTPEAADVVYECLRDPDFNVRLAAASDLTFLRDARAPADPEVWALNGMLASE